MRTLVIFTTLVGVAVCANTNGWDLDQIIDLVIADTDINPADGILSVSEITNELLGKWDVDPLDGMVTKHEFVTGWVSAYGDSHVTTNAFFNNLDTNGDHVLSEMDLIFQLPLIDLNGDGTITPEEFRNYMHLVHPAGHNG